MIVEPSRPIGRFRTAIPAGGWRSQEQRPPTSNIVSISLLFLLLQTMSRRVRHCIECPKCLTRYLLGFSPYRNGSYLVEVPEGLPAEWKLYCCCGRPAIFSCWPWSELKSYAVSSEAYLRGYGSPDEVMPISRTRDL